MIILAIDPGPTESAWVEYHADTKQIVDFGKEPNERLLASLEDFADANARGALAIETIASYGMPVGAEVFETCVWIGRFIERWDAVCGFKSPHPIRITRHEVKMHICKSPRANDATIRQALIDRFGPPGKKAAPGKTYGISGDVWSALAVAVTAADTRIGKEGT